MVTTYLFIPFETLLQMRVLVLLAASLIVVLASEEVATTERSTFSVEGHVSLAAHLHFQVFFFLSAEGQCD